MAVLWVTDLWNTLDHPRDTTLRLIEESLNLRIPTFLCEPHDLSQSTTETILAKQVLSVKPGRSADAFIFSELKSLNPSTFWQIHFRLDPPVDDLYLGYLSKLESIVGPNKNTITNDPDLIRSQSEKVPPKELWKHCPKFSIVSDTVTASNSYDAFKSLSTVVIKPMNTAQSIGVEKFSIGALEDWVSFLEKKSQNFQNPLLVQEFMPEIDQGETRLWFINGALLGTLKKYPKKGDFRVLMDEGSTVGPALLTPQQTIVAQDIGNALKKQTARMAAVDLIGEKISDYNITSPGLLIQLEQVQNQNLAKKALELLGLVDRDPESKS